MQASVAPVVYVHMTAALLALAVGTFQLARPKGTYSHKKLGWLWIALMLTVAISSLWIPGFLHFTWIHLFTALTLVTLPLAILRIRHGNVRGHAGAMQGLYMGGLIVAGISTLVPGRLLGNLLWKGVWGPVS